MWRWRETRRSRAVNSGDGTRARMRKQSECPAAVAEHAATRGGNPAARLRPAVVVRVAGGHLAVPVVREADRLQEEAEGTKPLEQHNEVQRSGGSVLPHVCRFNRRLPPQAPDAVRRAAEPHE